MRANDRAFEAEGAAAVKVSSQYIMNASSSYHRSGTVAPRPCRSAWSGLVPGGFASMRFVRWPLWMYSTLFRSPMGSTSAPSRSHRGRMLKMSFKRLRLFLESPASLLKKRMCVFVLLRA